ncbi:MAG: hypothetical protein WC965_01775 [Thiohalomonadaceae bacterium]
MTESYVRGKDIIVAVDIALNKTGIVIMSGMTVVRSDVFTLKTSGNYLDKLDKIHAYFLEYFDELFKMEPNSIELVLEGRLSRGFSGNVLASIEGARVTTYLSFHAKLREYVNGEKPKVFIYSPGTVKKFFAGRENATKSAMHTAVVSRFSSLKKIKFQEDVYDAIYLGLYHLSGKEKKKSDTRRGKKVS